MQGRKKNIPKQTLKKTPAKPTAKANSQRSSFLSKHASTLTTGIGLLAIWALLSWVYGDVLWRMEQDSYFTADAVFMKPLTDTSFGWMIYAMRYILCLAKYPWLGGLALSLILTACAELFAQALRLSPKWRWTTYLIPLIFFAYLLSRGFNLIYRNEPAHLFLIPTLLCGIACVAAGIRLLGDKRETVFSKKVQRIALPIIGILTLCSIVCTFVHFDNRMAIYLALFIVIYTATAALLFLSKKTDTTPGTRHQAIGLCVIITVAVALGVSAVRINDNVIATARMQRLMEQQDWEGMAETALSLPRPTRSVAAYYAIALEQQDALLEGLFDLPFDYPKVSLDSIMPPDEYAMFTPDCNLAAGLANPAYHQAFEQIVISGARLHWFKTMLKSAILNGEKELARKYVAIIRANPFEGGFCDRFEPLISHPELIAEDGELAHIQQLELRDKHPFEQNFQRPVFLGYNMGLTEGPDAVLRTSAAVCLYTKDLAAFLPRAQVFVAKGWPLPECMQEALVIYSIKHGGADFLKQFKGISPMIEQRLAAFTRDIAPIMKDKDAMRRELKNEWLGTYMYYYYCENNDPSQVRKVESSGVN